MKGRLTIKRKEKTAKRSERIKASRPADERRAEKERKVRAKSRLRTVNRLCLTTSSGSATTCICASRANGVSWQRKNGSRPRRWAI